jgi:hypothetical protein
VWFEKVTLEEQLTALARCGIRLRGGASSTTLLRRYARDQYESAPYTLALTVMGDERDEKPFDSFSDGIWHLDSECVEGPGSYIEVARRMSELARGDLPLENIADHVDDDIAWLAFSLRGHDYRWQAHLDDDWVDGEILSRFVDLLAAQKSTRRYIYSNLQGQDSLLGCATPEELAGLNLLGGPRFVWLH